METRRETHGERVSRPGVGRRLAVALALASVEQLATCRTSGWTGGDGIIHFERLTIVKYKLQYGCYGGDAGWCFLSLVVV